MHKETRLIEQFYGIHIDTYCNEYKSEQEDEYIVERIVTTKFNNRTLNKWKHYSDKFELPSNITDDKIIGFECNFLSQRTQEIRPGLRK